MEEGEESSVPATGDPARFDEAHRRLLEDSSLQFDLLPAARPEPPAWLRWLANLLEGSGPVLQVLFWAAAAAIVLTILYLIFRRFGGIGWFGRRRAEQEAEASEDWRPEEAPARALLGEADRLAAEGRYAEAAHLLLFRSIADIEARRPRLVRPALTSRDIAAAPALPPAPKAAFARIVMMVERSLFGARPLDAEAWRDCRSAYEEFAFAGAWGR